MILRSTPLSPLVDCQSTSRITGEEPGHCHAAVRPASAAEDSSDLVGRLEAVVKSAKADAEAALAGAEEASDNATLAAQAAMGASAAAGMAQVAAENANTAAQDALQSAQASEALALQAGDDASAAATLAQNAVVTQARLPPWLPRLRIRRRGRLSVPPTLRTLLPLRLWIRLMPQRPQPTPPLAQLTQPPVQPTPPPQTRPRLWPWPTRPRT